MSTAAFLEWVLPDDGHYVCWTKENKKHQWFDSTGALAARLLAGDFNGQTIYYGCSAFLGENRRIAQNVRSVKTFWLDVDAGDNKPYADAAEAAEAVAEFCHQTGLPVPLYVASGYGLYAIWPLRDELDPDTWRGYARGLKRLCQIQGLEADPSRTSDVASILRAPGTHNRKFGGCVEVQCGPLVGPYPIEAFGRLLEHDQEERKTGRSVEPDRETIAGALSDTYYNEPRSAAHIAESCVQIGTLKRTEGRLAEPLRHSCWGVIAYCDDNKQFSLQCSKRKNHPDYTPEELQAIFSRIKTTTTGATTCEHFYSLDPKTCEACPHWGKIKSPISLGRVREHIEQTAEAPQTNVFGQTIETPREILDDGQQAVLPAGFAWRKDGALLARSGGRNGDIDVLISSHSIYLVGVQRGEIRGSFSLVFRQRFPQQPWVDFSLPAASVFSSLASAELANKGANIHDLSHFVRYVRGALDLLHGSNKLTVMYDQFGWKHDNTAFLYGLDLYGPQGVTRVPGSDELMTRCREDWVGPCRGGNLEIWKHTVNALFSLGCEPHSVALLAAFAAPLIHFQDREEGGAIIHLVSRESGKGKSTALVAAASVWGRPRGLGLTNDDTKVTKALTLGALGNLPLIYDELTLRDPEAVRNWVIMFTNGRDRMRATRAGEIKHTAANWQTILVSAANTSLVDLLSMQDHPEAPAMRVIEMPTELPDSIMFAGGDRLKDKLLANSGWAGQAYLEWLLQPTNLAWVRKTLDERTQDVWARDFAGRKFESKHRFWVRTIAAIIVAGVIVKGLGLVDFSIDRIIGWLFEQIKGQLRLKAGSADWAVSTLSAYLNDMVSEKLVVTGPYKDYKSQHPSHTPRVKLSIRQELSPPRYYIAVTSLREWLIEHELSYREFIDQLLKFGIMMRHDMRLNLGAGTDYAGGQVKCVEINGAHETLAGIGEVSNVVPIRAAE